MTMRTPFAIDEWYHCYNRGVDKRKIFLNTKDYERFLLHMYVSNSIISTHISNFRRKDLHHILSKSFVYNSDPLVEIGAYSLMPNHFHFALKEIQEGGIALFMQKILTGYTMYFNKKYDRTGSLLGGTFKSKHVADDRYLKYLLSYIHLNPAELFDSKWKEVKSNVDVMHEKLLKYPYSSFHEFSGQNRPERKLLGNSVFELFDSPPSLPLILEDAKKYYEEMYQG